MSVNKKKRNKTDDRRALKWIFEVSRPQIPTIVAIIAGEAIWALFGTATALFSREIINSATNANKNRMFLFIGIYLVVSLSLLLVHAGMKYVTDRCQSKLEILFRNRIFASMLSKSFPKLSEHHTGDLVNRLTGDVAVISDAATTIVPQAVMMSVRLIFAASVLIYLQWQFALFFICGGILILIFAKLLKRKIQTFHKDMQQADGRTRSFWMEMLENLTVVKSFVAENRATGRANELMNEHYSLRMRRSAIGAISLAGTRIVIRTGHLFAIGYGAFCLYSGTMDYGTLTALTQLVGQVQQPFANMSGIMPKYYSALSSAERLMEIEALESDKADGEAVNAAELYARMQKIDIRSATFSYDGDTVILDDCTARIEKGDFVSITGMSGIGKSTLFKILLDIYPKNSGDAVIVATDGEEIPINAVTRTMFAYVPQGNMLFSGTIRENLEFFAGSVSDEQLVRALKCACADEFIERLPNGLDTVIGENGTGLSEGQVQRISFARAILSGSPILLLDEATSALDERTEAQLLENLKNMTDRTCIIVTHRPKALGICNRHFVIENKKIIEKEKI